MLENLGAGARKKPIIDKKARNIHFFRKKDIPPGFIDFFMQKIYLERNVDSGFL